MTEWDRKLWGIHFRSSLKEPPRLIGATWDDKARLAPAYYVGEPTRALLFQLELTPERGAMRGTLSS